MVKPATGFANGYDLTNHYKKKVNQEPRKHPETFDPMPYANKTEYGAAAVKHMNSPAEHAVDLVNAQGDRLRYDSDKNLLGIQNAQGQLKTFYSPGPSYDWGMNVDLFMRGSNK